MKKLKCGRMQAVHRKYRTNDYFSTPENPSKNISFVDKGLFRLYAIDYEGNEATLAFTGENMFMASYSAVILDQFQPVYTGYRRFRCV